MDSGFSPPPQLFHCEKWDYPATRNLRRKYTDLLLLNISKFTLIHSNLCLEKRHSSFSFPKVFLLIVHVTLVTLRTTWGLDKLPPFDIWKQRHPIAICLKVSELVTKLMSGLLIPILGSLYQSSLFHLFSVATKMKKCLLHAMEETGF